MQNRACGFLHFPDGRLQTALPVGPAACGQRPCGRGRRFRLRAWRQFPETCRICVGRSAPDAWPTETNRRKRKSPHRV